MSQLDMNEVPFAPVDMTAPRQRNTADAYAHKPVDNSSSRLKLGDPHKVPPVVPPLNRNPRKHDVVAWRNDGARIDSWRHDTKESALEFARGLPWVIYYQYAVTCGRDVIEQKVIPAPDGMALDDNLMPVKI